MVAGSIPIEDTLQVALGLESARTTTVRHAPLRAVQAILDKRRPRLALHNTVPQGKSLATDAPSILSLLEADEPCIILAKVDTVAELWATIIWVPSGVPDQRKRLHEKNAGILSDMMGSKVIKRLTASDKHKVEEYLKKADQDTSNTNMHTVETFIRTNTEQEEGPGRGSENIMHLETEPGDRIQAFMTTKSVFSDDPPDHTGDLFVEVKALREGLLAVQTECNSLRRRLDAELSARMGAPAGGPSAHRVPAEELEALKNTVQMEKQLRGVARLESDELKDRIETQDYATKHLRGDFDGLIAILDEELTALNEKAEHKSDFIPRLSATIRKSQNQAAASPQLQQQVHELKERVDVDCSVLKLLKGDFDGLVAILDEEITSLNEKTENRSDFVPRISAAVRKSQQNGQQAQTVMRQEVEELKERMDDAEKAHLDLKTMCEGLGKA